MEENLVSIIVPVFNAGKYLDKCIQSIINQEYRNIEIILVNDGSADNSYEICQKYAELDDRVIVCTQTNQGNTAARRHGLNLSKGEYIAFVDADDYVEKNYIDEMLCLMLCENPEVVIANVKKIYSYGAIDVTNKIIPGTYENTDFIIENMFYYQNTDEFGVLPYLYAKLYKKDFIYKGFESIGNELQYAEDRALMLWSCINAQKIVFTESNQYRYVIHEQSLCTVVDEKYLVKVTEFYVYTKKLFQNHKKKEILLRQLDKYMVRSVIHGLNRKMGLYQKDLITRFYLPEDRLPFGKRVVLYGAGTVGRDFYKQLKKNKHIEIVAWCDENYERINKYNPEVCAVDNIKNIEYDYIIIGVINENIYNNIVSGLINHGIRSDNAYWIKPERIY